MALKILFVCTGNTCRSPLAEMIARRILAEQGMVVETSSAGLYTLTGMSWSADSLAVAAELGLDTLGRCSTLLTAELLEEVDLVLVMAVRHLHLIQERYPGMVELEKKLYLLKEFLGVAASEGLEVRDPFGENIEAYRAVAAELLHLLKRLPEKLRERQLI